MKDLFSRIPRLKGERVTLRELTLDDADDLREMTADEEVYRYLPTFLFEKKYDDAQEVITKLYDECIKDSLILGVFMEDQFCGLAEIYGYRPSIGKACIGCRLIKAAWGKGIAAEVLELLLNYLMYETDIEIIAASTMSDNKMSPYPLSKLGFKRVARGVYKDWGYEHPIKTDIWVCSGIGYRRNNPENPDYVE